MALLTIPGSISKGSPISITLDKTTLFNITAVKNDSHFGVQANCASCVVRYEAAVSGAIEPEKKVLVFDLSESTPSKSVTVSAQGQDTFSITEILVVDQDGGVLAVPAAQIPSGLDLAF